MNRKEEYAALRREMETVPEELQYSVDKALNRKKTSQNKMRLLGIPTGSLAACVLVFILLVNLIPTFAYACGRIPVLRELAKAVAWSPSLSAAVEQEFVQPVGREQSKNGVTARVEYLIVDQKQLNVFYTLKTEQYGLLEADASITLPDGGGGFSSSSGSYGVPNGELRQLTVDFMDREMPEGVTLKLDVYASEFNENGMRVQTQEETVEDAYFYAGSHSPAYLAAFSFALTFDPYYTAQGEILAVNQTFQIAGQTLTLRQAEIYPTHLRLDFDDDSRNTAWLKGLEFYVENERGERFDPVSNGIIAAGEEDSPAMVTYWLNSPYFSGSKTLTLHITQALWLDKDREKIRLDLETGEHDPLPDGVKLAGIDRREGGYLLTFTENQYQEGMHYFLWQSYFDAAGTEYDFASRGIDHSFRDPVTGERRDGSTEGVFYETVPLVDYQQREVYLKANFSSIVDLKDQAEVEITFIPDNS